MTAIVDANGMSNSFTYSNGLASMSTPYGTTTLHYFNHTESDQTNGYQIRAILAQEPDGASQFFSYIHNTGGKVESTAASPTVSTWQFDNGSNGGSDEGLYHRNSFYWDRSQVPKLSVYSQLATNLGLAITNLTSNDLLIGRMQHWLLDTDGISITETLSSERDPSPDAAGTIEGSRTWYAYTNGTPTDVFTRPQIGCMAQILPDGSTNYTTYSYYSTGLVSNNVQSFSLRDNPMGELTNSFYYATNGVDLIQVTNSMGQYVNIGYHCHPVKTC